MTLNEFLNEEFKTGVKTPDGEYYEIFYVKNGKNFSKEELKKMGEWNGTRFALDLDTDTLYVWDNMLLHYLAHSMALTDLEYDINMPKKCEIWGEATTVNSGGTMEFLDSNSFNVFAVNARSVKTSNKMFWKLKEKADKSKQIMKITGLKEEIEKKAKRVPKI